MRECKMTKSVIDSIFAGTIEYIDLIDIRLFIYKKNYAAQYSRNLYHIKNQRSTRRQILNSIVGIQSFDNITIDRNVEVVYFIYFVCMEIIQNKDTFVLIFFSQLFSQKTKSSEPPVSLSRSAESTSQRPTREHT